MKYKHLMVFETKGVCKVTRHRIPYSSGYLHVHHLITDTFQISEMQKSLKV